VLIAAGLFLRTFRSLEAVPLGFVPDNATGFLLWPQDGNIPLQSETASYARVLDRLESLPSVEAAAVATSLPISSFQIAASGGFSIPGHLAPGQKNGPQVRLLAVSPGYFRAMRIRVVSGRALSEADSQGTQLFGVVNQAFIDRHLPGVNPIGQQIVLDKEVEFPQPITIVGVSGNVVQGEIGGTIEPQVAVSYKQLPPASMLSHFLIGMAASFAVRTKGDSQTVAGDIREIVKNEAPAFAIDNVISLSASVQNTLGTRRRVMEIATAFAWIALLLSAAGLYGVLAYLVGQRVRELGIRLALGATRENVFVLVFRHGLLMVGTGLLLGLLGALIASRWIRSFLFGVTTHDPATYVLVGLLIVLASAVAIFLPARRAASIEPMEALRRE
jgi:putative ABC transport system permease protein